MAPWKAQIIEPKEESISEDTNCDNEVIDRKDLEIGDESEEEVHEIVENVEN